MEKGHRDRGRRYNATGSGTRLPLPSTAHVTNLLVAWGHGDDAAFDRLVPLVHAELRRIARRHMGREREGHTLQATALVNEAYLRWSTSGTSVAEPRALLCDVVAPHATSPGRRRALPRIPEAWRRCAQVTLDEGALVSWNAPPDVVALDDALNALAAVDERKSQVVELRFFGGLERRGDGRSAGRVGANGQARLDDGEAVVAAGAQGEAG